MLRRWRSMLFFHRSCIVSMRTPWKNGLRNIDVADKSFPIAFRFRHTWDYANGTFFANLKKIFIHLIKGLNKAVLSPAPILYEAKTLKPLRPHRPATCKTATALSRKFRINTSFWIIFLSIQLFCHIKCFSCGISAVVENVAGIKKAKYTFIAITFLGVRRQISITGKMDKILAA